MIKIKQTGKWAQVNPAKPHLNLTAGENAEKYPQSEVKLMIKAEWASEEDIGVYFPKYKGGGYYNIFFGNPDNPGEAITWLKDGKLTFRKKTALQHVKDLNDGLL